jgi:hypothetical protein
VAPQATFIGRESTNAYQPLGRAPIFFSVQGLQIGHALGIVEGCR